MIRAALWLLFTSGTAHASTFAHPCDADLATPSHHSVVRGHVATETTRWHDARLLVTTYTVTVDEVLAGEAPSSVTVTVPGGTWDGWVQQAAGVPLWTRGEPVLLMLDAHDRAHICDAVLHV